MKRTTLIAAVTAVVLTAGASPALAGRGHRGNCRCGGPIDRLAHIVPDLTEQQQEQLEQILEKGREEMRADRVKMLKLRRELRELVGDGADEATTDAKIDAITSLKASMMKQRIALLREAREVLTEEQREVLKDIGLPMIGFGRHGAHGPGGPGMGRGMRQGGHGCW